MLKALKDKSTQNGAAARRWAPSDKAVSVNVKEGDKAVTMTFKSKDGKPFGEWISSNLDSLYEAFRKSEKQ